MKPVAILVFLAALIGCSPSHKEHDMNTQHQHTNKHHGAHDEHSHQPSTSEAELIVLKEPMRPTAGDRVNLELMIHGADGRMVNDFEVVHEQKIHLIVVRDDLEHFAHLHPTVDSKGNMRVAHVFAAGGTYRLYAEYKPRRGTPSVAVATIQIAGEVGPSTPLVPNVPGKITDEAINADIATESSSDKSTKIVFNLRDNNGRDITKLDPWMGELGHLVILNADGNSLVHSHVERRESHGGRVVFNAKFPSAGVYKGWGQFKRYGEVRTLPFVVRVS